MDEQELLKIKERIAKLLAMAADASSPNEAAIAAGRARSLMDKYQISEFDVSKKVEDTFDNQPAFDAFSDTIPAFMSTLAVAVAQYNDTHARYEHGHFQRSGRPVLGKRIRFMGFKADVELAVGMYTRLHDAIRRLTKEWFKEQGLKYSARLARQFELGAVQIISQRIRAMTKERDEAMSAAMVAGTSLMVIKKQAVDEEFGETKYGTRKSVAPKDDIAYKAQMAGRVKGAAMEIHPSVEA